MQGCIGLRGASGNGSLAREQGDSASAGGVMTTDADDITLETRVVRKEVFASTVGDELILFDEDAGAYFATGPVGARIWNLIESERSIADICAVLLDEFDVDSATCESASMEFLRELREQGLAVFVGE